MKTNKDSGIGQRILATLNSLANTKDLLWYFILFLTMYVKRTYGAPALHHAFLPIAAHPTAWITSRLEAPVIGTRNWDHMTGIYSSHGNTAATTTDTSAITSAPDPTESSVELPIHTLILIAAGSLITMMTGLTLLFRHLLHRNASPPDQFG